MKPTLLLALLVSISTPMFGGDDGGYVSESKTTSEIFTSTITDIFSASDGDYMSVAYIVTWKNQKVAVTPMSARHFDLAVGDAVRCEMRQMPIPPDADRKGTMRFTLIGRPVEPMIPSAKLNTPDEELMRLEAIADEIHKRRAERQERMQKPASNP